MKVTDIARLIASGVDAGFEWLEGKVSYRPNPAVNHKVSLGLAPHVKVIDVVKFEENFPGVILAALNGTSILVQCQGVTRRALKAVKAGAKPVTPAELREAVINSLRGMKNRTSIVVRTEKVFTYANVDYSTREEALVAEFADKIASFVDAGLDSAKAREIAERQMLATYGEEAMAEVLESVE
jgi:hypothetical protein